MVSGHGEPRDVPRALAQFDRGVADGQRVRTGLPRDLGAPPADACFRDDPAGRSRVLQGRFWSRRALVSAGAKAAASGDTASLFVFSPTSLYHRVHFDAAGFWVQTGGLFGRAERTEPVLQFRTFAERCRQETARVAKVRGLHESLLDVSVE
jgi:hypothetical protein